jgi:hypothetical protein
MSKWPTADLIRINRGKVDGNDLDNCAAVLVDVDDLKSGYYILTGPYRGFSTLPDTLGDSIDDWEPVTPVPTRLLKDLEKAWSGPGGEGCNWLRTVDDALHPLLQVDQLYRSDEYNH